jgi:hypothetical protein
MSAKKKRKGGERDGSPCSSQMEISIINGLSECAIVVIVAYHEFVCPN